MKDVALYEGILTKLNSYFSDLYFIFYEFSNLMNGQVVNKGASFFPAFLYCTHMKKDGDRGRHRMRARVAWQARSVAWLPMTRSIGGGGDFGREPAARRKR
jgi:hypothetical protein